MIQNKDLLIISIFTVITVFVWIVSDVYHSVVNSQITKVQEELIEPLNPKFDVFALENIRSRAQ